jgi:hypothetical protein
VHEDSVRGDSKFTGQARNGGRRRTTGDDDSASKNAWDDGRKVNDSRQGENEIV